MALADRVQARFANRDLVALTRNGSTAETTVDTTRLGLACDAAEAEFLRLTGLEYDDDDDEHVNVAVLGAIVALDDWNIARDKTHEERRARWEKACKGLSLTRGAQRVTLPQTTSRYDPSQEREGERPAFDRDRQRGYVIGRRGEQADDQ